ncbi:MAG TPA: glycoside hydrolase domain-containing protein, partial [Verrucomicrobiae bacterium]|nr:glycoside hydrolase domain-containing protein [Verrucomicrobiae bacterium]
MTKRMRRARGGALLALVLLPATGPAGTTDPVEAVNPIIGTTGPRHLANYGGVCPWVAPPHGMTDWTPMTQENRISQLPYRHEQRTLIGFMGTHQPTVWMGDYGFLTLMPETGPRRLRPEERGLSMVPGSEIARPYCYSVQLQNSNGPAAGTIGVAMTASSRCAMFKIHYPGTATARLFIEMSRLPGYRGWIRVSADRREIVGYNPDRHNLWDGRHMGPELKSFKGWYVIQFEKPMASFATWEDSATNGAPPSDEKIYDGREELEGERIGVLATFGPGRGHAIKVRIGSSFISEEQARDNLRKEIPDWNFDRVADRTRKEWNEKLNRIEVEGGTADERTIFYTALYHSLLFPRTFSEYGRYYSAFDEKIHQGISYNDYSMW